MVSTSKNTIMTRFAISFWVEVAADNDETAWQLSHELGDMLQSHDAVLDIGVIDVEEQEY